MTDEPSDEQQQEDDEGAPERPRFTLPPRPSQAERPENPFRNPPVQSPALPSKRDTPAREEPAAAPPPERTPPERAAPERPPAFSPQSSRPVPPPDQATSDLRRAERPAATPPSPAPAPPGGVVGGAVLPDVPSPAQKPEKLPPSERGVPFERERQEVVSPTPPLHTSAASAAASGTTAAMSPPVAPLAAPRPAPPAPSHRAPTPPPPPAPALPESATVRLEGAQAAAASEAVTRPRTVLAGLDVRSVFRLALAFYLATFAAVMVAAVFLWFLLGTSGVLSDVEGFVGELLGYENFRFLGWKILQVTVLVGLLWVVTAASVTAGLVFLYNRVSDIVGGVQVETKEAPRGE